VGASAPNVTPDALTPRGREPQRPCRRRRATHPHRSRSEAPPGLSARTGWSSWPKVERGGRRRRPHVEPIRIANRDCSTCCGVPAGLELPTSQARILPEGERTARSDLAHTVRGARPPPRPSPEPVGQRAAHSTETEPARSCAFNPGSERTVPRRRPLVLRRSARSRQPNEPVDAANRDPMGARLAPGFVRVLQRGLRRAHLAGPKILSAEGRRRASRSSCRWGLRRAHLAGPFFLSGYDPRP